MNLNKTTDVSIFIKDERGCLNDHIWNSTPEHLSQTWSKLLKTTNELEVLKDQIEELRLENKGLRNDVAAIRQQFENNKEEMSSLKRLIETVREHKVEATEDKRPDTPLNSRKQLSSLKTLEPIKQKSRPKSAMSLGRAHEKKETDYSMYPQRCVQYIYFFNNSLLCQSGRLRVELENN